MRRVCPGVAAALCASVAAVAAEEVAVGRPALEFAYSPPAPGAVLRLGGWGDQPEGSAGAREPGQAAAQPADEAERARAKDPRRSPPTEFGREGTHWLTVGSGVAYDFDDNVDSNVHVAYTYFLIDRLELTVETAGWLLEQDLEESHALGHSAGLVFRYHHVLRRKWSLYTEAGIGALLTSDDVPDKGTSFNLTPRVGAGVTRQVTETGIRLQAGVRWHHISNARITGESNNPARDGAMVYVGLQFPL